VYVKPLDPKHEAAVEELLLQDPAVNLFLLAMLDLGLDRTAWLGVEGPEERMLAVAITLPGLTVPFAPDPAHARAIGVALATTHRPDTLVGPRAACDALLAAWTPDRPAVSHAQRLYVAETPPVAGELDVVRAAPADAAQIAELAAAMEREDLGRDPARDPVAHRAVVDERIADGRSWIARQDGAISFMVHVGTRHPLGAQIGGTYVPPRFRGQGLSVRGMAVVTRALLAEHPRVTLHVREANTPAVRAYERVGFRRAAAFRLTIQEISKVIAR